MRTKTIKAGSSIIGKIKYMDEPLNSTASTQDCPPGVRIPPVPRIRPVRFVAETPRLARSVESLSGLRSYQAGRPVVNESVDTWRSRAAPRPRAARATGPRRDGMRRDESPDFSSRASSRASSSGRRERTPVSRHRGTEALDMSSIIREFEEVSLHGFEDEVSPPTYEFTDNFFPNPKITFFMDRPTNLVCSVCQETPLKMSTSPHTLACENDSVISPCGHVFCRGCLDTWIDAHQSCPLCRFELTRKCGHAIEPRVIAKDTILSLPPTLPEGGKVAPTCWDCRQHAQAKKLGQFAKHFRLCRQVLERCKQELAYGSVEASVMVDKAQVAYNKAQKDLEQFSKNTTYENTLHIHSFW
ncbi:hypothetical protein PFICI_03184 [Pestalotiopsis fici W106-1]|uniref:RING-type domain-containing protein n=1 Tax=Pestalotiopsis fici (strain W106-1 / CGMCC3.15140) TaxID=1229662 RepID=W3XGM0_PESFW|nr:uncharacterized protein PFICI_03184 [Pestalotiopsis fici W106-1]ETS85159.1 hypothetical protein PFICI_03184 [Pestalotiopsis fici W106-1]